MSKPNAAKLFAKQLGWQEAIVRLLILRPRAISKRGSHISYVQEPTNQEPANNNTNQGPLSPTNENIPFAPLSTEQATSVIPRPTRLGDFGELTPGLSEMEGAVTPQFTKKRLFHDPTESDLASLCTGLSVCLRTISVLASSLLVDNL